MNNAMYIVGGLLEQKDIDFLVSHKIFTLFWQTGQYFGNTIQPLIDYATVANINNSIRSYDSRFKILAWVGFYPNSNHPNLSDPATWAGIFQYQKDHVLNGAFDGLDCDLEGLAFTLDGIGNRFPELSPLEVRNLLDTEQADYYTQQTQQMHSIGKLNAPFCGGGAGLWTGNFWGDNAGYNGYFNNFGKNMHVDAIVQGFDNFNYVTKVDESTKETENDKMGYLPTLRAYVQYCPSPTLVDIASFATFPTKIQWLTDYVKTEGTNNILGWMLYDYKAGLAGTPPLNQLPCSIKTIYNQSACETAGGTWLEVCDSPYPPEYWDLWEQFIAPPTLPFSDQFTAIDPKWTKINGTWSV